jgi:hypothetical protein
MPSLRRKKFHCREKDDILETEMIRKLWLYIG